MAASSTDYMTIGGAVVKIDGNPMGFTDNGIEVERTLELKDFEDGIPLQIQLRTPIREKLRIKFPAMEVLDADKLAMVSLNVPVTNIAGGPVSVEFGGSPGESEGVGTFAPFGPGSWQGIQLPHKDIENLVVKDPTEATTYDVFDDYYLDAEDGIIWWVEGGAIASGQQVHYAYDGTAIASKRLRFGTNSPLVARQVEIIHTSPVSGKVLSMMAWKVYFDGKLQMNPNKEEYWKTESECFAVPHLSHPDEPLGYYDIADAA